MRRQLERSNEVAAALRGSNDQILRALEGHADGKRVSALAQEALRG